PWPANRQAGSITPPPSISFSRRPDVPVLTRREVRRALRYLMVRREVSSELDAELRHHVEMETARYIETGLSPAAARSRAEREFGHLAEVKKDVRAIYLGSAPGLAEAI